MAVSDALYELAARASAVERNVRDSQDKARADLEAKVAEARKAAEQHADELRARDAEAYDDAQRSWNDVQQSWKEHVAHARERIADKKAELDVDMAERRAEWAEDDALDAIDFAAAAVDEAEYATLDAVLARKEADELAAS